MLLFVRHRNVKNVPLHRENRRGMVNMRNSDIPSSRRCSARSSSSVPHSVSRSES